MKFVCLGYMEAGKFEAMSESERGGFMDACFAYDDTLRENGHFAGGECLQSSAVTLRHQNGKVTVVDGPYAEAKEVVGGWAILQYDTLEDAVADQEEFAQLHAKYWPEVTVISTLRQISTGPEAPGD